MGSHENADIAVIYVEMQNANVVKELLQIGQKCKSDEDVFAEI